MTILSRCVYQCHLEQAWKRNAALLEFYLSRLQPSLQDLHAAIHSQNLPKVTHMPLLRLSRDSSQPCQFGSQVKPCYRAVVQVRWVLSGLGRGRVDSSIRSTTALSLAVSFGSPDVVEALLVAGADPDKLSWSPLPL